MQALATDDEYAAAALDKASGETAGPLLAEWSPTVDILHNLTDRLGLLISLFASANGGKATFQPLPRPATAFDRVRRQRVSARHEALVARVIPN